MLHGEQVFEETHLKALAFKPRLRKGKPGLCSRLTLFPMWIRGVDFRCHINALLPYIRGVNLGYTVEERDQLCTL